MPWEKSSSNSASVAGACSTRFEQHAELHHLVVRQVLSTAPPPDQEVPVGLVLDQRDGLGEHHRSLPGPDVGVDGFAGLGLDSESAEKIVTQLERLSDELAKAP